MSDILDWAKKEVEIACKKENPNKNGTNVCIIERTVVK